MDIIETRETEPVKEWIKTFPCLRFVSRDGSVAYRSAIAQANENITQISDRFHLLKGLTDAAKKYIMGHFKANIGIPVSGSHYDGIKTALYWTIDTGHVDLHAKRHISATERKMKLVKEARMLYKEGMAPGEIAERMALTAITVKKYLKPDFNPENPYYNTTCLHGKLKPYEEDIKRMLSEGHTFTEIEKMIRQSGFDGSSSAIRMFATRERRLIKDAGGSSVERVERKWLLSLLYKPIDRVKDISPEQLDKVIKNNPVIGKVFDIVKKFKGTLFSKKEAMLDKWIKEATLLEIDEINSFIGGIKRDIEAVKNAITYDFNNGLAEGSVNKLKVIKRIMYGRCTFYLLKKKLLKLESLR